MNEIIHSRDCAVRCRCWERESDMDALIPRIVIWREEKGFVTSYQNLPEKLMLIVTELSEAMEAYRYTDIPNLHEELADVAIRLFDLTGSLWIDLPEEIAKKMRKNEMRSYKHGKVA